MIKEIIITYTILFIPVLLFVVPFGWWVSRHPSRAAYILLYGAPYVGLALIEYGYFFCYLSCAECISPMVDIIGCFIAIFIIFGAACSLMYSIPTAVYMFLLKMIMFLLEKMKKKGSTPPVG